ILNPIFSYIFFGVSSSCAKRYMFRILLSFAYLTIDANMLLAIYLLRYFSITNKLSILIFLSQIKISHFPIGILLTYATKYLNLSLLFKNIFFLRVLHLYKNS